MKAVPTQTYQLMTILLFYKFIRKRNSNQLIKAIQALLMRNQALFKALLSIISITMMMMISI